VSKKLIRTDPSVHVAEAFVAGWVTNEAGDAKARVSHAAATAGAAALEARAQVSEDYTQAMGVIAASAVHRGGQGRSRGRALADPAPFRGTGSFYPLGQFSKSIRGCGLAMRRNPFASPHQRSKHVHAVRGFVGSRS